MNYVFELERRTVMYSVLQSTPLSAWFLILASMFDLASQNVHAVVSARLPGMSWRQKCFVREPDDSLRKNPVSDITADYLRWP